MCYKKIKLEVVEYSNFISKKGIRVQDCVFCERDIHGLVGNDFVLDEVYNLGKAIAYFFLYQNSDVKTVAIGMNDSKNSEYVKDELIRAFCDSGLDVIFIGICQISVLYFSLHTLPVNAGIMISGDVFNYNVIKVFLGKERVLGANIEFIKNLYKSKKMHSSLSLGTLKNYPVVVGYTKWLANQFKNLQGFDIAVLVDCINSSTESIFSNLILQLNLSNIRLIKDKSDLRSLLNQTNASFGIGFDSKGDKLFIINRDGNMVTSEQVASIFSRYSISKNYDSKANVMYDGHYCFSDRYFGYDDPIYAFLRLLEVIKNSGKSLEEFLCLEM